MRGGYVMTDKDSLEYMIKLLDSIQVSGLANMQKLLYVAQGLQAICSKVDASAEPDEVKK